MPLGVTGFAFAIHALNKFSAGLHASFRNLRHAPPVHPFNPTPMKLPLRLALLTILTGALVAPVLSAAPERIKIKLAPMPGIGHLVPELARGLGYFESE